MRRERVGHAFTSGKSMTDTTIRDNDDNQYCHRIAEVEAKLSLGRANNHTACKV